MKNAGKFKFLKLIPAIALVLVFSAPANAAATCTALIGGGCPGNGGYSAPGFWPGSNGSNTYVINQAINVQSGSTGSVTATSPSSWTAKANYTSCGGCVQTFTAVQQLTNNWGNGGFNGSGDLPLSVLKKLQVVYTESMPGGSANQAEFSPDLWTDYSGQEGGGSGDIMMWADTTAQRCDDNGLNASNIIGQADLSGQNWTVYSFGPGEEIIFILDPADTGDPVDSVLPGTSTPACGQQTSGTLHVLEALKWLANNHVPMMPSFASNHLGQFNTGFEITAGNGQGQYAVTRLAYKIAT